MKVGFSGLGDMGGPMAMNLLGHDDTVIALGIALMTMCAIDRKRSITNSGLQQHPFVHRQV